MTDLLLTVAQDFCLGLLLGGVGGIFGIGGGLIAIPVLIWLFGMNQQLAQGTALVMIAPNVLLGFWRYKQRNPIEMKSALILGAASIVSTYVTAKFAANIGSEDLRIAFACFLIGLAVYLGYGLVKKGKADAGHKILPDWCLGMLGVVSGLFSGLFTVGGGLVVAPMLTKYFGIKRQTTAQGLALATVTPGAVVALYAYATAGKVDWATGLPLAVGGLISISWGVALAHALPEKYLRLLFCFLIIATAVTLF